MKEYNFCLVHIFIRQLLADYVIHTSHKLVMLRSRELFPPPKWPILCRVGR